LPAHFGDHLIGSANVQEIGNLEYCAPQVTLQ
jgi:hypothetical protein